MESIHDYLKNFTFLSEEEVKNLSKNERGLYNEKVKNYRDLKNVIDYARELGEREISINIAEKLILKNYSFEDIADVTDLSLEEVQNISDYLNEL